MLCATQPSKKEAELALAGEGGGLRARGTVYEDGEVYERVRKLGERGVVKPYKNHSNHVIDHGSW